jgi:hypothetical protein
MAPLRHCGRGGGRFNVTLQRRDLGKVPHRRNRELSGSVHGSATT